MVGEGNACLTSKGHLGSCTSFRQCYPYFKIPDLTIWESWVLGNYDSCSYFNEQGRQAFGVCCTNPVTSSPPLDDDNDDIEQNTDNPGQFNSPTLAHKVPYPQPIFGNYQTSTQKWPPDFITHPSDHTAPTHPPASPTTTTEGSWTSTTTSKTTTWATKPPIYQHITTSTTENPAANYPASAACGVKNGSPVRKIYKFQFFCKSFF